MRQRVRILFTLLGAVVAASVLLPATAQAASADDDSIPSCPVSCISVGDVTIVEGDTGTRTMAFPITLSQPSSTTVTVQVQRIDGEAIGAAKGGAGIDYRITGGRVSTLTFKVGASGKTPVVKVLNIQVYGDTDIESRETLRILLSSPTGGARLARPLGIGTILDDDTIGGAVRVSVGDSSIVEGDLTTTRKMQFPVTLSRPIGQPVLLQYAVNAPIAQWSKQAAYGDFGGATTGLVWIGPGKVAKSVYLRVWPDATFEPDEKITLTVSVSSAMTLPPGVVLTRPTGTGTIIDDDAQPDAVPLPNSMAALGDSISRGFNACPVPGDDCLAVNWSTGTDALVGSHYTRILARNPGIAGRAFNYAVGGATMSNLNSQANKAVTQGVDYVTVEMGTNDACKSAEGLMTPVTTFRNQFQTSMSTIALGLPSARVFVASIPDPLRLWEIGKNDATARTYWSFFGLCQSMLANPQSSAPEDAERRLRVQQRVVEYNDALAAVCAQFANCRFDDNVVFNTDFVLGDLTDYFHPNVTGQALLASQTYAVGWNW